MNDKIEYRLIEDGSGYGAFIDGHMAGDISFVKTGDSILIIDHTAVSDQVQGQGVGTELVRHVVEMARKENKKIIATCPFAKATIDKHPEFQDVLVQNNV